jgi:short-subunit dehydrogenase
MQLKDKVVLITGASSGFGADAARLFAREGAKVVLVARRIGRLQCIADEIRAEGGEALVIPADVSNADEIAVMVQSTLDFYGKIDILFNNAGFGHIGWLETLDEDEDIKKQIAVNLTGLIEVAYTVLPHMLARGEGHIINMASAASWMATPLYSIYAATKFGVRGFSEALRREVSPLGVQVSTIYPGPARTEFDRHTGKKPIKEKASYPGWVHLSSEFVAAKVVQVAKYPRRTVFLPWWLVFVLMFNSHFPRLSDWLLAQFSKKHRS